MYTNKLVLMFLGECKLSLSFRGGFKLNKVIGYTNLYLTAYIANPTEFLTFNFFNNFFLYDSTVWWLICILSAISLVLSSFVTNFNTPEHKFKASFGNTDLFENFGFNIAYRFSDDYYWESTFGNGVISEFHTLDAQINLRVPSLKSTFKAGGTNLTGKEYYTAFGTGFIGSMYYVSWTINNF